MNMKRRNVENLDDFSLKTLGLLESGMFTLTQQPLSASNVHTEITLLSTPLKLLSWS